VAIDIYAARAAGLSEAEIIDMLVANEGLTVEAATEWLRAYDAGERPFEDERLAGKLLPENPSLT